MHFLQIHLALYCFANGQLSTALKLLYRARYLMLLVCGEDHPEMALLDVSYKGLLLCGYYRDTFLPSISTSHTFIYKKYSFNNYFLYKSFVNVSARYSKFKRQIDTLKCYKVWNLLTNCHIQHRCCVFFFFPSIFGWDCGLSGFTVQNFA